jgi:predicted phage-related endonuclease
MVKWGHKGGQISMGIDAPTLLTTHCEINNASKGIAMTARKTVPAKATKATTPARPELPVALDRTAQRAVRELRALKAQKDELDIKIKDKEKKIKEAMGDYQEATVGGVPVVTWKLSLRSSLDQTKLKENYPDAAAQCTKMAYVRTFKLLGEA